MAAASGCRVGCRSAVRAEGPTRTTRRTRSAARYQPSVVDRTQSSRPSTRISGLPDSTSGFAPPAARRPPSAVRRPPSAMLLCVALPASSRQFRSHWPASRRPCRSARTQAPPWAFIAEFNPLQPASRLEIPPVLPLQRLSLRPGPHPASPAVASRGRSSLLLPAHAEPRATSDLRRGVHRPPKCAASQPLDVLQLKTDTSWWVSLAPHFGQVGVCSLNLSCSDIGRVSSNRSPHLAHSNS